MKKFLFPALLFFFAFGVTFAQDSGAEENPVMRFDEAVRILANNIHAKFIEKRAGKIIVGQFAFMDSVPPFSSYWVNQLIGELTNMRGRNYTIYSGSALDAEWTITGEIVQVADIIRVYTTLIRMSDRAVEGSFYSSFARDGYINDMMGSGSSGSSSSSAAVSRDSREPDDWDNPVHYSLGTNPNVPVMNRTLTENDEDFFLFVPDRDGRLTAETTGNTDTYMQLYNYDNNDELDSNDDGGQQTNAKIVHNVRAGTRYIAVVRGYTSATTGSYGFRAFLTVREGAGSWDNPHAYELGADENNIVTVNRNLQESDEDHFLIVPARSGRIIAETTGRIDTFMQIFDADSKDLLDENDDGGQNYNARVRYNVETGNRYMILVRGYSSSVTGSYGFRAYYPGHGFMDADEYEPNDEPSQATPIEVDVSQQHTFHTKDDIDWFKFQITRAGRYNIHTRGVNSNRLDTYIELFDSNLNLIAEDDDGGNALSSMLSVNLNRGSYYLKVWCLDEEPEQAYVISINAE